MDPRLKAELTARDKWLRLLYILAYVLMFQIAEIVLAFTVVVQFILTLFTGDPTPISATSRAGSASGCARPWST
jgi:polyferredoxin